MDEPITLTASEDGIVRDVMVDQFVVIRLMETPTTGYRWTLRVLPADAIEVTDSDWQPEPGTQVGGSGQRVFRLLIRGKRQIELSLKLWREWQGEGSVVERRHFTLVSK